MRKRERAAMTAEMQRELDAVDAALRGEAAGGSDPALVDLARTLQAMRPRPSEQAVLSLDARAAAGFRRKGHPKPRAEPPSGWRAAARLRRAFASKSRNAQLATVLAVALALVAVAAISQWSPGGETVPQHAERASGAPSASGPAVAAPTPASKASATQAGTAGREISGASGAGALFGAPARRIERTSTLDLGVTPSSIESSAQRVFTTVSSFNGYVRQSNVSSGAQAGASFDIRLPTSSLTAGIAALSHLGHVRSENDTTHDLTDQFDSLRRSLGDLRGERASLLRQLAGTADAERAGALKARLRTVEARIAQAQGTLRSLSARVDYTGLSLSLTPEAGGASSSGDLTPGGAARNAAQILEAALAVLVLAAAALLPVALLCIAAWIAAALTRRRLRERALDAG